MPSNRRSKLFASAALAFAPLLAVSCAKESPTWPEGTVFVMDGVPITGAEIDAYADPLAAIGPSYARPHRRRVVLTEVLIPRARARSLHPEERRAALERLESWHRSIETGAEDPPEAVTGNWSTIGMPAWLALQDCAVGEWSETFELPGTVARAKLISRDGNEIAALEVFECLLIWSPYAAGFSTDPAIFGGKLEVVAEDAEAWRAVLPTRWLYELEGPNR